MTHPGGRSRRRQVLALWTSMAAACAQPPGAAEVARADAGFDLGGVEDVAAGAEDDAASRDAPASCEATGCRQRATQLHVGWYLAQARLADGQTVGWGWNLGGNLGQGDFHLGPRPVAIPTESRLFLGLHIDCRVDPDRTLWCWGLDASEVLGVGHHATDRGPSSARRILDGVLDVAITGETLCAVREDHHVDCLGKSEGFSIGSVVPNGVYRTPMRARGVEGVARMAQSSKPGSAFCAFSATQTWCWGPAHWGLFGETFGFGTPPRLLRDWAGSTRIGVDNIACSLDAAGLVGCAGSEIDGLTGAIHLDNPRPASQRTLVQGLAPMTDFSVGKYTLCGVDREGSVWCTGNNQVGQAGIGSTERETPPRRLSLEGPAEQVGCGAAFCCARLRSGQVWCWGENDRGQLGRPRAEMERSLVPVRVTWE
ncbi:MAG: hypothetical protein R3A48_00470 [Polyangiales bacterium]